MKIRSLVLSICVIIGATSVAQPSMDKFIDTLMSKMTLQEKLGQLNLPVAGVLTGDKKSENIIENIRNGNTGGVFSLRGAAECRKLQEIAVNESRLGIPLLFGFDVIHGFETSFPIPLALASSWDVAMIERMARISADEASSSGINWAYSPMVDICRDARWGRIAEGAGEDPFLGGEIAKAYVRGYQGDDFAAPNTLMACVKHFALYGAAEAGRDYNTAELSRQTMMNIFMPPYKAAVDAGVGSVMAAFNEFEGVPLSANDYLINDVLRRQWGFQGFVASDYNAIGEMIDHGIGDGAETAQRALNAGIDMDMVSDLFVKTLATSLEEGKVTMKQIDVACRRILEAKYKLGLFDDPYRYCDTEREKKSVYTSANRQAAREIASQCMVLLKNDNNLLPLDAKSGKKIALIGPLAATAENLLGTWSFSSKNVKRVSLLDAMKKEFGKRLMYAKGCNVLLDDELEQKISPDGVLDRDGRTPEQMRAEALEIAQKADVIVAAMGETRDMTGEGACRADVSIPEPQKALLRELKALGKPVVLVLFTGRPLVLTWENENLDAILNVWFAGAEGGLPMVDVLVGRVNPSAKLTTTFPYHVGQLPLYYNSKNTGRPWPEFKPYKKYNSCYIDVPNGPVYPFGYGLSYTRYDYGKPSISAPAMKQGGKVTVTVPVTNAGKRDGAEVVQLYIRDVVATSTRPVKELKAFQKVHIAAGQTQNVVFEVNAEMLKYYNHDLEYVIEPGEFQIMVGPNSRDVQTLKLEVL